jgi:hypothetical protein
VIPDQPHILIDDSSPTSVIQGMAWHPRHLLQPDKLPERLSGTNLFDHVRTRFRHGLSQLDNLLRFLEQFGPGPCKGYRTGIDALLGNLVSMAKWLVSFLENVDQEHQAEAWASTAVVRLRLDLQQYSWKVTRVTSILRRLSAVRPLGKPPSSVAASWEGSPVRERASRGPAV